MGNATLSNFKVCPAYLRDRSSLIVRFPVPDSWMPMDRLSKNQFPIDSHPPNNARSNISLRTMRSCEGDQTMKVRSIKLRNFRCFGDSPVTVDLSKDLTALVGANGSGKTAILMALTRLFGPTQSLSPNPPKGVVEMAEQGIRDPEERLSR